VPQRPGLYSPPALCTVDNVEPKSQPTGKRQELGVRQEGICLPLFRRPELALSFKYRRQSRLINSGWREGHKRKKTGPHEPSAPSDVECLSRLPRSLNYKQGKSLTGYAYFEDELLLGSLQPNSKPADFRCCRRVVLRPKPDKRKAFTKEKTVKKQK